MSQRLRRTAAAAREILIDLAAETWKADRAAAQSGRAAASSTPATGQKLEFGKLTKGQKLTKVVADDCADACRQAGRSPGTPSRRSMAARSSPASHQYASDIRLPGMLVRQDLAAARRSVRRCHRSTRAGARAMPGVIVVHDGDFVGVAAPSEMLGGACAGRDQGGVESRSADLRQGPLRRPEVAGQRRARGRDGKGQASRLDREGWAIRPTSISSRRTRSPTSPMRRSSRARPSRGGTTAS